VCQRGAVLVPKEVGAPGESTGGSRSPFVSKGARRDLFIKEKCNRKEKGLRNSTIFPPNPTQGSLKMELTEKGRCNTN
jgi:hypothetical protein